MCFCFHFYQFLKKHEWISMKEYQYEFRDWKKQFILMVVIKSILKNKCKNDSINKLKFATQNFGPVWALTPKVKHHQINKTKQVEWSDIMKITLKLIKASTSYTNKTWTSILPKSYIYYYLLLLYSISWNVKDLWILTQLDHVGISYKPFG